MELDSEPSIQAALVCGRKRSCGIVSPEADELRALIWSYARQARYLWDNTSCLTWDALWMLARLLSDKPIAPESVLKVLHWTEARQYMTTELDALLERN